jgi:hypothetical protein
LWDFASEIGEIIFCKRAGVRVARLVKQPERRLPIFRKVTLCSDCSLLDRTFKIFRAQDELNMSLPVHTNGLVQIHRLERDQLLFSI